MDIKIKCPDCKKEIKIKIHKIDKLENEIRKLKEEKEKILKDYNALKTASDILNQKNTEGFKGFEDIFGGFDK